MVRVVPSAKDQNYHVEVLQKQVSDPAWKFRWLAPHMAVTVDALRSSIRGTSKQLENYPETFENAYRSWAEFRSHDVCATTVESCLK